MAVANKAFVWLLFAAGGTLTALLFPVVIALFLLLSMGQVPSNLDYGTMHAFASSWIGRLAFFTVISLSAWHAAHRMRSLTHDLGIRSDKPIAILVYTLAAAATVGTVLLLATIGPDGS